MATSTKSAFPNQRSKAELYLVPPEMVARAWHLARFAIQAPKTGIGRDYDIARLYGRLVLGVDRLWMAAFQLANVWVRDFCPGVVITSLGAPPKDMPRKLFDRKDKKSLTVHFVAGWSVEAWIPDALEKITAYGKEHGVKQLFVLARFKWLHYFYPFYDRFERVGMARDRMTKRGCDITNGQQRPGHFRLLSRDLPPRMSYDCARHSTRRLYIPPKGVAYAGYNRRRLGLEPGNVAAHQGAAQGPDRGAEAHAAAQ